MGIWHARIYASVCSQVAAAAECASRQLLSRFASNNTGRRQPLQPSRALLQPWDPTSLCALEFRLLTQRLIRRWVAHSSTAARSSILRKNSSTTDQNLWELPLEWVNYYSALITLRPCVKGVRKIYYVVESTFISGEFPCGVPLLALYIVQPAKWFRNSSLMFFISRRQQRSFTFTQKCYNENKDVLN